MSGVEKSSTEMLYEPRLNGRVAVVSGGSRGIGRAIVLKLAAEGASVLFTYGSNTEAAEETRRLAAEGGPGGGVGGGRGGREGEFGDGRVEYLQADAASEEAVQHVAERALSRWGRIDIAVSCAGVMYDNSIEDTPLEEWRKVIDTNLTGYFLLARAVIPAMKRQEYGRIIALSSQAAFTGTADHAHYGASKAGVLGFTYSAAKELGAYGITVNVVTPGRIHTDMLHARSSGRMDEWLKQIPLNRLGEPGEVAAAVAFLSSKEASYITGANINVAGGQLMG